MRLHNLLGEDGRIVKGVNTTVDVGPDEIKKQAKKFGNTVDKDGNPPTLSTKVKGKSTNVLFNLGLFEEKPTTNIRKNYNEFARFCVDTLAIQKFPKITMTGQALDRTFGYFDIDEQSITVSYNNRHQMDTMRTLAHELVHCKQREEREDLDGSDGSPDENEANAMAGVLLRRWADKNPNLFSESVEIIDESWAKKYITKERSQTEATEIASATKIYVDMDGVLADFFTEWGKLMGKDDWRDIGQEHIPAALEKIKQTENFWLDLPLTSNAKTLLKLIKDIKGSYTILSSPLPGDPNSEPHKLEWIKNNLSFFPPEEILIRHDKETFATQEDGTPNILIDDYGVNIQKWEAAGGVGFKHKDHKFERTADAIKQHMQEPVEENFADGKVSGNSRPGRVKRSGASCNGSVTDLRKRAKNASGERAKMLHWCANMKAGKQK